MRNPFLVEVQHPHEWSNGFTARFGTLEEAESYATELARGKWGEATYRKVSIYSLVREVN